MCWRRAGSWAAGASGSFANGCNSGPVVVQPAPSPHTTTHPSSGETILRDMDTPPKTTDRDARRHPIVAIIGKPDPASWGNAEFRAENLQPAGTVPANPGRQAEGGGARVKRATTPRLTPGGRLT